MTSSVSANYGGYRYESSESRALGGITTESYDYRDQGKTIAKLTGDVSYLAGYMRKMQKGIDSANQNVIQQIQSFINDIIAILAGGGDTGLDFGDLKYILQAFGALFGFDFTNGLVLPINLFDAAWHFFSQYVLGVENFGEAINQFIDNAIAGVLDLFGEIPIVGTALRQLAAIITAIRDAINTTIDAVGQLLWDLWHDPGKVLGQIAQSLVDGLTTALTNIGGAINGVIEAVAQLLYDLWTDPGKVLGQIAQSLVDGLTTALTNVGGAINTVVDAVAQLLYDLFNEPSKVIGQIAQDMVIGLSTALTNLGKFINDVIDAVESAFRGIPIVGSGIANMIDGLQGFFNGLFGQPTPAATVKPGAVPSLDAAKITTGSFGSAQISDSAISNAKLGSDISGDKIVAGTVTSARIAALDAAKITTGSFGSSQISDSAISNAKLGSDISGDKIVAGTVVAGRIGALDAAKITTGSFGSGQITAGAITNVKLGTDISGDKIVTGTVVAGRIGSLDAAKITTGSFGSDQITAGAISNIKLGTDISGDKIVTGTVVAGRIGSLDAAKITTGSFGTTQIPTLPQNKITGLPTNVTVESTLIDHGKDIADLKAANDVAKTQGKTISVNFTTMANASSLPTTGSQRWSTTYSGAGTATWGIANGKAAWVGDISSSRSAKIIYTGDGTAASARTLTDYQVMRGVLIDPPSYLIFGGIGPKFTAMARVSEDGNTYVWARAYFNGTTLLGELGCTINGVEQTPWQTNIPLTWSTEMTLKCGSDTNVRTFQVYSGSVLVTTYTDSSNTSRLCDLNHATSAAHTTSCTPYRRFGAIATYSGNLISGTVSSVSVYDNPPVVYAGSLARMSRVSTGTVLFSPGVEQALTSFFDTQDYESLDIDGTTADGTFLVTKSKMYHVSARIRLAGLLEALASVNLQYQPSGSSSWYTVQRGDTVWSWDNLYANVPVGWSLTGTWLQYLNAGDKIRLSVYRTSTGGTANILSGAAAPTGATGSSETYFAISALA